MGIVYCNFCGEPAQYWIDAKCPNDIIQSTGYVQDDSPEGLWICPECQKKEERYEQS